MFEGDLSEDVDGRKVEAKLLSTLGRETVRNFVFVSCTMSRKGTVNLSDSRVNRIRSLASKSLIARSNDSDFNRETGRFWLKLTVPS